MGLRIRRFAGIKKSIPGAPHQHLHYVTFPITKTAIGKCPLLRKGNPRIRRTSLLLPRSHRLNHFRHWRISFPGIKNGSLEKSSENCYNIPEDCSDRRLRPRRWDIPHDAIAHQEVDKKFHGKREKCGGSQGVAAPPCLPLPFGERRGSPL